MSKATGNAHDWHCEEHNTFGWRGESCKQCPTALSEIESLREQLAAKHPSASLTWLFTHCLAIGMDCRSDSGKLEHDIALFTSNQKKEIESLREQLIAMEDKYIVERGMRRLNSGEAESLRQQLAASQKREVMLREALEQAIKVAKEVLAAMEPAPEQLPLYFRLV